MSRKFWMLSLTMAAVPGSVFADEVKQESTEEVAPRMWGVSLETGTSVSFPTEGDTTAMTRFIPGAKYKFGGTWSIGAKLPIDLQWVAPADGSSPVDTRNMGISLTNGSAYNDAENNINIDYGFSASLPTDQKLVANSYQFGAAFNTGLSKAWGLFSMVPRVHLIYYSYQFRQQAYEIGPGLTQIGYNPVARLRTDLPLTFTMPFEETVSLTLMPYMFNTVSYADNPDGTQGTSTATDVNFDASLDWAPNPYFSAGIGLSTNQRGLISEQALFLQDQTSLEIGVNFSY